MAAPTWRNSTGAGAMPQSTNTGPAVGVGWRNQSQGQNWRSDTPLGSPGAAPQPTQPPPAAPAAVAAPAAPAGEMYGPGFGEQYIKSHIGAYDQPSSFEQFAQSQLNGSNPYYDRMRQQGEAGINQQMIARGNGNSGGALAALGNFDSGMYANQFKDMGSLLQGAAQTGMNRTNSGMSAAGSAQGMQEGRVQQQWNNLSDLSHLGAGTVGGFYGQGGQMSGDAAMSGINAGANAAQLQGQGQSSRSNALWGLGGAALGYATGGKGK